MIVLLLILAAPIIQIILSTLRVKERVGLPIGAITILSFILGIALTFVALNTRTSSSSIDGLRCDFAGGAILLGGIFLQMITAPIISIISYGIYRIKRRNNENLNEHSTIIN